MYHTQNNVGHGGEIMGNSKANHDERTHLNALEQWTIAEGHATQLVRVQSHRAQQWTIHDADR